jgi:putative SOS response-associated peptidase YedK
MCGFVSYENATIREYPQWVAALEESMSAQALFEQWPEYMSYPAFGGDINRRIPLLVSQDNQLKRVDAIWWFDAYVQSQQTLLGQRTSFNARNLDSPFWKGALNNSRGIVLANQIGESKPVGKGKHQFLMQSNAPFMLGAIYRKLENGDYCCAIITRDAHPKMTPYHEKAFPLFLPIDMQFLHIWLGPKPAEHPQINALLSEPKLFPTLHVQRVKTYKSKQVIGKVNDVLISDLHDQ